MRINILFAFLIAYFLINNGCDKWRWTVFEYYNRSIHEIYVDVVGVKPDPSPGFLVPSDKGEISPVASSHFGDPVFIDDNIKIIWKIGRAHV
mgnify:CR=1 FL=1